MHLFTFIKNILAGVLEQLWRRLQEGPIPFEDDVEIVHVDQLPSILSEEQKATLQQQIELTGTLTEE